MKTFKFMGVELFTYYDAILIQPLDDSANEESSMQYLGITWKVEVTDFVNTFPTIQVFFDGTFTLWDAEGDSGPERIPFGAIEGWRKESKLDYPASYYQS